MSAVGDARKRTEAAQSSPGAGEVEAARASRSLNLTVQDALVHRLKWASLHWRTADVNSEAWPHLADAVADHVLASDWLAQHDADLIARVGAKTRERAWDEGVHVGYEARQNDEVDGLGGNQWWESPNVAANPYRADEQVTP